MKNIDFSNLEEYKNLTEDQIEEWLEIIDWSIIPSYLITESLKKKFQSFPDLQLRIWFEEILDSIEIHNEASFSDPVSLKKDGNLYMEFDKNKENLWCSYDYVWVNFNKVFGDNIFKFARFIKNILKQHPKTKKIFPSKFSISIRL